MLYVLTFLNFGWTTPPIAVSYKCIFHVQGPETNKKTCIWGTRSSREIEQQNQHSEELTVWRAVSTNAWVCPYYFNNEAVKSAGYYQKLYTHISLKSQQFPQNASSQQNGDLSHVTNAVRSLLDKIFPHSWIAEFLPTGWPEKQAELSSHNLDFLRIRKGWVVSDLCA